MQTAAPARATAIFNLHTSRVNDIHKLNAFFLLLFFYLEKQQYISCLQLLNGENPPRSRSQQTCIANEPKLVSKSNTTWGIKGLEKIPILFGCTFISRKKSVCHNCNDLFSSHSWPKWKMVKQKKKPPYLPNGKETSVGFLSFSIKLREGIGCDVQCVVFVLALFCFTFPVVVFDLFYNRMRSLSMDGLTRRVLPVYKT